MQPDFVLAALRLSILRDVSIAARYDYAPQWDDDIAAMRA